MRRLICLMTSFVFFLLTGLLSGLLTGPAARAQTTVVREGAETLLQAAARYFGKASTREFGEELTAYGGEAFVRKLTERLVRESGEETLESVAALTAKHGPDVLRAIDRAPSPTALLRAVDELPAEQVGPVMKRLSAGRHGQSLAALVERHGVGALSADIAHPGIGMKVVQHLGDDGMKLTQKLSREEAITVARHAEDIARLPHNQRAGVLRLLDEDTKGMVALMGRFVERHPGKTLFTAAATTIVLANPERFLGGDEVLIDRHGNPQMLSKPGLLGRAVETGTTVLLRPLLTAILPFIAIGAGLWIGIRLWFAYRLQRLKFQYAAGKLHGTFHKQAASRAEEH